MSRLRWLFVIARNSSFTYKGRAVDVKQVGRELGVRYVLEGSVRKAGSRVRITGQLIDATTGAHLWADRFDGELADVFDLQDQVTASVVGAIAPEAGAGRDRARSSASRQRASTPMTIYLRGMAAFYSFTKAEQCGGDRAVHPGHRARSALRRRLWHGGAMLSAAPGFGWVGDRDHEIAETRRLCRSAAEFGRDDAVALSAAGGTLIIVVGDLDGRDQPSRARPGARSQSRLGLAFQVARECLRRRSRKGDRTRRRCAMRLSPQDPQMFAMQFATALGHFFARRFEEASDWAETAQRNQPRFLVGACAAAASAAMAGRMPEAERAMAKVRELYPELRLANIGDLVTIRRAEDFELWSEALRRAGLPE